MAWKKRVCKHCQTGEPYSTIYGKMFVGRDGKVHIWEDDEGNGITLHSWKYCPVCGRRLGVKK